MSETWNVARYLIHRLGQLGIDALFGVPGNHLGPFLEVLAEERAAGRTKLAWIGTPTEIGAGSAADGYARIRGVGAVAVTYGVGAFSLLNPIGGAYVEEIPLIVLNGTPTYEQWLNLRSIGLITSHMSQRFESNLDIYRQVTADAQAISIGGLAPWQIDAAFATCVSTRKPVYLEVTEDVFKAECAAPEGEIEATPRGSNRLLLKGAIEAAVAKIRASRRPILWGGEEIDRLRLADDFQGLVEATELPFCTTIGAKSVLSENHPQFHGVYNGKASLPEVRHMFKDVADLRIGLGAWSTSKNLGGDVDLGEDWIKAAHEGVTVGSRFFPKVQLGDFLRGLRAALDDARLAASGEDYYGAGIGELAGAPESRVEFLASLSETEGADPGAASMAEMAPMTGFATIPTMAEAATPEPPLTYDNLFARINKFLDEATEGTGIEATNPYYVVSDAAFALLGSQNLHRVERRSFFAQNAWLAIGYSVGAATGIKLAKPDKRSLVFVGDGSFQETCQEMSSHTRLRQDSVVFVLNNEDFYGIEQMLVHPCFYAGQEPEAYYNVLHPWNYARFAEVFGSKETPMTGFEVRTFTELEDVLRTIADPGHAANRGPILVQVRLARRDYPAAIGYAVEEKCRSANSPSARG